MGKRTLRTAIPGLVLFAGLLAPTAPRAGAHPVGHFCSTADRSLNPSGAPISCTFVGTGDQGGYLASTDGRWTITGPGVAISGRGARTGGVTYARGAKYRITKLSGRGHVSGGNPLP